MFHTIFNEDVREVARARVNPCGGSITGTSKFFEGTYLEESDR